MISPPLRPSPAPTLPPLMLKHPCCAFILFLLLLCCGLAPSPLSGAQGPKQTHELAGLWWVQTIYSVDGEPLWSGASVGDRVELRIGYHGTLNTVNECNMMRGWFGPAVAGRVQLLEPKALMTTRRYCIGSYPPVVRYAGVVGYRREGLRLRLFDKRGLPIADYLYVRGLEEEPSAILRQTASGS